VPDIAPATLYRYYMVALRAPIADDLTFAIEPPEGSDVVEADQQALS
jgi:hypothetical protein